MLQAPMDPLPMPTLELNLNEACSEDSKTSGSIPTVKAPSLSSIIVLLTICLFVTTSAASPLDILSSLLLPRQDTAASAGEVNTTCGATTHSCDTFTLNRTYTKGGTTYRIGDCNCSSSPCYNNISIVNPATNGPIYFDRTIGGSDADAGIYDHLFGVIAANAGDTTGWNFAASVGVQTTYEYVATTTTILNVFPIYRCISGVVDGCASDLAFGLSNGTDIEACEIMSLVDDVGVGSVGSGAAGQVPLISFNVVQVYD